MEAIEEVVGRLVSQLPGYETRPQQARMARVIADAIAGEKHALIEAGTGSGKSFGYLIPLLESGKKAVISTGTIALQEQLLYKDIPFLERALGRRIKVALAKGRANYVCLRRLRETDTSMGQLDPFRPQIDDLIQLVRTNGWDGDRGALPFVVENRLWGDLLASDPEDCLASRCPNFGVTPHRIARIACDDAELVIANHALYFTDLITGAGVLPKHEVVVFDEAHHLDRAAVGALTVSIGRWSARKLLQRLQRRFDVVPPPLTEAITKTEEVLLDYIYRRGRGQFPLVQDPAFAEAAAAMAKSMYRVADWISRVDIDQMKLTDTDPATAKQRAQMVRDQMGSVAQGLAGRWEHFATLRVTDTRANWMHVDPAKDYFELQSAPLEVGDALQDLLWGDRTCILTSATLAVDGKFEFLKRELGIPDALEAVLGSPFNYRDQSVLYVPRGLPEPTSPRFTDAIVPHIEEILKVSGGRAFVLFTSHRALREVSGALLGRLPYPCKVQDELPRPRLIEWFKSTPNSVLFATATFWEGVDIPGDALSCVIIDKLPFANPDDPVVSARTDRMKSKDEDWFNGFMLPKAILSLKQGFGRLIRSRTDQGLVAILDPRVMTKRYGSTVLRSLPPARIITRLPAKLEDAFGPEAAPKRAAGAGTYPFEPPPGV